MPENASPTLCRRRQKRLKIQNDPHNPDVVFPSDANGGVVVTPESLVQIGRVASLVPLRGCTAIAEQEPDDIVHVRPSKLPECPPYGNFVTADTIPRPAGGAAEVVAVLEPREVQTDRRRRKGRRREPDLGSQEPTSYDVPCLGRPPEIDGADCDDGD